MDNKNLFLIAGGLVLAYFLFAKPANSGASVVLI